LRLPDVWVLDIDDTLYLERDYVFSGFNAVGEWLYATRRTTGFADCCWNLFEQGVRGRIFNQACEVLGIEMGSGLLTQLIDVYRKHSPVIALAPDAREFLDCPPLGRPVAILTGGSPTAQRQKVAALELTEWTPNIVYAGWWGTEYDKPHSRGWVTVQDSLETPPESLVYVADNPRKDFETPLALGWSVIRIRRPGSEYCRVETPPHIDEVTSLGSDFAHWITAKYQINP